MAHEWKKDDVITAALLNDLEERADKAAETGPSGEKGDKGDKGDKGASGAKGETGASVSAIAFTKDEAGVITGGTATLSDGKTVQITVS